MLCLVLAVLLFAQSCNNKAKLHTQEQQWQSVTDKIKHNADSTVASVRVVVGSQRQVMKILKHNADSMSIALAEAIKKGKGKTITATVIEERVHIQHDSVLVNVTKYDTIRKDSTIVLYANFESQHRDEWLNYKAKYEGGTFSLDLITYNSLKVTTKKKRGGIELLVENKSPYALTTDAKSYSFDNRIKGQFDIGLYVDHSRSLHNNQTQLAAYTSLKYKAITGEISAGVQTEPDVFVSPYIGGRVKYALFNRQW